jgi:TonB family protein
MSHTYDLYFSNSSQQTDSSKYFGVSIFLHVALAAGCAFVTVPMLQKINTPITIEILDAAPIEPLKIKQIITEVSKGEKVKATRGAKMIRSPRASSLLDATESDIISVPVAKSKTSRAKMATMKTKTGGGKSLVATSAPSRAGIPETIEDIQAEQLDLDTVSVAQLGALGEDELESDFKNIDKKSDAALRAQKSAMDAEARMISDEQDQALAAIENDNKAQARAMADSLKTTRTKNAATLAQIKASEQAAAERAARDESDRRNKALAAANANGMGDQGRGRGESGADQTAKAAAGNPNAVRSVDSLRQVPGNPKPQYATDERIRREQGQVIFHAFVTAQGTLENFKLVRSTGYKNLDGKSLSALKKWKFYPGQQGWVEIPQVWNLKGDIEKMPTLLRRQVSQR